ncbi:MAG: hypothetical protein HOV79_10870 [Hamadaea sp.]|nr:hypothetical protein [Hamadaea sp.]
MLDGATSKWVMADGDGSKIDKYTGPGNYGQNSEVWKITTADGTQYHFGLNRRPNWDNKTTTETNSALNVPVYSNHAGEPCYNSAGFSSSRCTMTWRWNLDYVVDSAGNSMTYFYYKETPKTGVNGSSTNLVSYDRAGMVQKIEYGTRAGLEFTNHHAAEVWFTIGDRCFSNCWSSPTAPVTASWPDVPWDKNCQQADTSCPNNKTPSFWTYKLLSKVTTKVWDHTMATPDWKPVDEWALDYRFPATGEASVDPALWLGGITHTGLAVKNIGDPGLTLPSVRFDSSANLPNRAGFEAVNAGVNINRWRLSQITNEFGGRTLVNYGHRGCEAGTSTPDPDNTNRMCFPQQYTVPDNSSTGFAWWNKYVVDKVTERDLVGGGADVVHSYSYWNESTNTEVLWRHNDNPFGSKLGDRTWSDFRGYADVITTTGTGTALINRRKQTFFRGINGDRTDAGWNKRTGITITNEEGQSYADSNERAGFLFEEILRDPTNVSASDLKGGRIETITSNYPVIWQTGSRTITGAQPDTQRAYVVENDTTLTRQRIAGSGTPTMRVSKVDHVWDTEYDRITKPVNDGLVTIDATHPYGLDVTPTDDTCTATTYAFTETRWMTNRVSESWTYGNDTCASNYGIDVLKGDQFYYDNQPLGWLPTSGAVRGLQTAAWALDHYKLIDGLRGECPGSNCLPVYKAVSSTEYDLHGRVTKLTDALGKITTTTYTPTSDKAVTAIDVDAPMQMTTTRAMDLRRGLPLAITDVNGKVTTGEYDALGRVAKVWLPGRATGQTPDIAYTYAVQGTTGPSYTTTATIAPNGNLLVSYEIIDGLGRARQTRASATNGLIVTDTTYDSRGLVAQSSSFNYSSAELPSGGTLLDPQGAPVEHRYTYDGLGRQTVDDLWSSDLKKWTVSTTTYQGDRVVVDAAVGGIDTTTHYDVFGRTTMLWQHKSATEYEVTRYEYDRLNEPTKLIGPDGAEWVYTYDLRGRRVKTVDPDAGTSTIEYDARGQVIKTVNALTKALVHTYDDLGRKTGLYKDSSENPGNQLAGWTYDSVPGAKGQLGSSSRYIDGNQVGGIAYTRQIASYNARYQPTQVDLIIPAAEGALAGTYTTTYNYLTATNWALSSQTTTTKSGAAVGGLPNETLTYTYNGLGQATGLQSGSQTYIADAAYTYDGLVSQQIHGLATGKQVKHTNTYDAATRRLKTSKVETENQTTPGAFDSRETDLYGYDENGNVTYIADDPTHQLGSYSYECFTYDYLRRLTSARTYTDATIDCANPHGFGSDPYHLTWEYWASTGNRKTETSYNTDGSQIYKSNYAYGGTGKPMHALTSIATTVGTTTTTKTFEYDAAGNTIGREGPGGGGQELHWNEEGKLYEVVGSSASSMVYDADNARLIRDEPGGYSTLTLPDGTELRANGTNQVIGTRYYPGGAVRTKNADAQGSPLTGDTLTWTISDHHGTGSIVVNAGDLNTQRRRSLPFGSPRGSQPEGFGTKGFVGGTNDATGLVHIGAREYDPAIGRFVSVDPVFDGANPQSWNGYSYASDNPVTFADPSGLRPDCGNGTTYATCDNSAPTAPGSSGGPDGGWDDNNSKNGTYHNTAEEWVDPKNPITLPRYVAMRTGCVDGNVGCHFGSLSEHEKLLAFADYICIYNQSCELSRALHQQMLMNVAEFMSMIPVIGVPFSIGIAAAEWNDGNYGAAILAIAGVIPLGKPVGLIGKGLKYGDDVGDGVNIMGRACNLNSFDPNTLVLMADGTTKQIREVRVGDEVLATDPETAVTSAETVTQLHINDDTQLTLLTVADEAGHAAVIDTTWEHPFWSATRRTWVNAADLKAGERLYTTWGAAMSVLRVENSVGAKVMYNLTVSNIHTYYVLAGDTPVLVHNEGGDDYNQALNKALAWLDERGFVAERTTYGKFGTIAGQPIGMQTADGKTGFRIEFDERNGAHINVWSGKEKGPHFNFDASESTVTKIQGQFGCK